MNERNRGQIALCQEYAGYEIVPDNNNLKVTVYDRFNNYVQ